MLREFSQARKAAEVMERARERKRLEQESKPRALSERDRRAVKEAMKGLEPDPDVRMICPVIAHKLFGKSQSDQLNAGQRRQVAEFARAIVKEYRLAGRLTK